MSEGDWMCPKIDFGASISIMGAQLSILEGANKPGTTTRLLIYPK